MSFGDETVLDFTSGSLDFRFGVGDLDFRFSITSTILGLLGASSDESFDESSDDDECFLDLESFLDFFRVSVDIRLSTSGRSGPTSGFDVLLELLPL